VNDLKSPTASDRLSPTAMKWTWFSRIAYPWRVIRPDRWRNCQDSRRIWAHSGRANTGSQPTTVQVRKWG
jgi:hypothetical protein